jgi:hypothetical protein
MFKIPNSKVLKIILKITVITKKMLFIKIDNGCCRHPSDDG